MICKGCGLEINDRAETCYKCGTIAAAAGGTRPCPACAEEIAASAKKCRFCNEWLDRSAAPKPVRPADDPAMRLIAPIGVSPMAIAAGYLGLFAVLGIFAPIALLVSLLAIKDLKANPEKHGMGRAIFGLVMGGIFTLLFGAIIVAALIGR